MATPLNDAKDANGIRPGYWFVPHLFGIGATPVTWQGWASTLGYVALMLAVVRWLSGQFAMIVVGAVLSVVFLYAVWVKTDGGLRWRWGTRA